MKIFLISLLNLIKFILKKKKKKEFIFYSESGFYRDHFIDLILNLKKADQSNLILITSDEKELKYYKNHLLCLYIESFFCLSIFFKILNCKFMIMTLTDLGNHFQKSKNCKYYVYFFHALASTHKIYTNLAFKNYDIIFSNGEYQSKELRLAEKTFNFPKKKIINSGYFYLDNIKRKADVSIAKKRCILFAPSWNYDEKNLFDDYSLEIINLLILNNFKLILRPHPEHYKRSFKSIKKIKEHFKNNPNFSFDNEASNLNSLQKSVILITDNSSIVFEFMFVFQRPIIYLNYKDKLHNIDVNKMQIDTIESDFKKKFGNQIDILDLKKLPHLCEKLLREKNFSSESLQLFFEKYLSNIDNSASFASNYLVEKLNNE